jgi:hypothetical protein
MTAPPAKPATIPPVTAAEGDPKYSTNFGCPMVEVMMPLS